MIRIQTERPNQRWITGDNGEFDHRHQPDPAPPDRF